MLKWLVLAASLLAGVAHAQERPTVAVVNYPLAYFTERLAGDGVEVLFPVPPDRDPSFWRPSIGDITQIQHADLIVLNGAGFAGWTTKASLPRSRLVVSSAPFAQDYIATETITHSHGAEGQHSHTGTASYTWLDFRQAAIQAETLAAAMKRRIPQVSAEVERKLPGLVADLQTLDGEARTAFAPLAGSKIIATHPRYQYLARAYGLEVEALQWEAGALPDQQQWDALAALVEQSGARTLLWEAQPPEAAIARAKELGLTSLVFPPLANRPEKGDFLTAMQASLRAIGSGPQAE